MKKTFVMDNISVMIMELKEAVARIGEKLDNLATRVDKSIDQLEAHKAVDFKKLEDKVEKEILDRSNFQTKVETRYVMWGVVVAAVVFLATLINTIIAVLKF